MRFDLIRITGGQADTPDPRAAPADVPHSHIKETPQTVTGTDRNPGNVLFTLEGTAGHTVTVQQFVLDETQQLEQAPFQDNPVANLADRRFYSFGATQVVTVGQVVELVALPGKVYYRLTSAPAADAVLKIGYR